MTHFYKTVDEIEVLVKAFEDGSLPNSQFNHAAHLTVAAWYLSRLPFDEAVATMRASIKRYAAAHGHDRLYHETITLFWLKLLQGYMEGDGRAEWDNIKVELGGSTTAAQSVKGVRLLKLINGVISEFGDTRLIFEYYSRDLLFSAEARAGWVEPDVKPL